MATSVSTLPLGVAILAVLVGLLGLFIAIIGVLVLLAVGFGTAHFAAAFGVTFIGGLLLTIVGIVILAVAKGLWDQELWALVISILAIGFILLGVILQGAVFSVEGVVLVLFEVYLLAVNRHFR
jgi:hypothetical protein